MPKGGFFLLGFALGIMGIAASLWVLWVIPIRSEENHFTTLNYSSLPLTTRILIAPQEQKRRGLRGLRGVLLIAT